MPTIIDVAKKSGFSKSTVSRVITNDPNVNPKTREIILQAIEELDYKHNELARGMHKGSVRIVLFIVGDMLNSFHTRMIKGITDTLARAGYMTVISDSGFDTEKEINYLDMVCENKFAGVIMMAGLETGELCGKIRRMECPVILLNRVFETMDLDYVAIDNFQVGYQAARHLIDRGHREILHLTGSAGSLTNRQILSGFKRALDEAGFPLRRELVVYGQPSWDWGYQFAQSFRRSGGVSAAFAVNYRMAAGLERGLSDQGVRIPEDLSVICQDEMPRVRLSPLRFTTVVNDPIQTGRKAAKLLLTRIEQPNGSVGRVLCAPTIEEGESVAKRC